MPLNSSTEPLIDAAEWAENLRGLRRSIASASGSQILICLYDSQQALRRALDGIHSVADELKIPFSHIEIKEGGIAAPQSLIGELEKFEPENRGIAAVTGLYLWQRGDPENTLRLRQLNIYRDLFVGISPPVQTLFFISEPLAGGFAVDCSDLWAYRSGLFLFQSHPETRAAHTEEFSRRPDWRDTLTREQKLDRIGRIDDALANTLFDSPLEKKLLVAILNEKGMLKNDLGDYNSALAIYKQALKVAGENNLSDQPSFLLNNIGSVLESLGDLDGAKDHYDRALKIDMAVFGENHPNIAIRLNNIGSVLKSLGDLEGAKDHYDRALKIDMAVFGENHPDTAISLNNIGSVLKSLGDLDGAKDHFERALKILERFKGKDHSETKIVRKNLELLGK